MLKWRSTHPFVFVLSTFSLTPGCGGDDDGDQPASAVLHPVDSVTESIGPTGGTIEISDGRFSLEFPEGALAEDTEITVTAYAGGYGFGLEPSGLTLAANAVSTLRVPASELDTEVMQIVVPMLLSEGDRVEPASDITQSRDPATDEVVITAGLPHFSEYLAVTIEKLRLHEVLPLGSPLVFTEDHRLDPMNVVVRNSFVVAYQVLTGPDVEIAMDEDFASDRATFRRGDDASDVITVGDVTLQPFIVEQQPAPVLSDGLSLEWRRGLPAGEPLPPLLPDEYDPYNPPPQPVVEMILTCVRPTDGQPEQWNDLLPLRTTARLSWEETRIEGRNGTRYTIHSHIDEIPVSVQLTFGQEITCERPSIGSYISEDDSEIGTLFGGFKPGSWRETPLSDLSDFRFPERAQRIHGALDPLLEVSAAAATRLFDEVFPCGEGPVGLTVCADGATTVAGDYVFLLNQYGADLPLEDPTGLYTYSFVFDADGVAANDYEASPDFPADFYAGTDLWYELTYDAGAGFGVRVRDVRQGFADVPSGARFVIAGPELGIFVPRSELDGAAPTFRTTVFRHEGDYGLDGGVWSGDYLPRLADPLFAVSVAEPIVLED